MEVSGTKHLFAEQSETMAVSDDEFYEEENTSMTSNTSKKGENAFAKQKAGLAKGELDEQLRGYIAVWKKQRAKEEEELQRLKEKQAKRKEIRAEQEKKLAAQKREEEEKARKVAAERKAIEEEEKKRALEEAERKRQEMLESQKEKGGKKQGAASLDAAKEINKTKEQLEEEMKISLSIRIKPLDLEIMDSEELRAKATQLWEIIVSLEKDKYDYEQRQLNQEYELKQLKEKQKIQLRNRALKKGLDPEAFTGKYPPKIRMFSKYERRIDIRTYLDRKKLYEGGWEIVRAENLELIWKEKFEEWTKRQKILLPKWFGERPGKKPGDKETPEVEDEDAAGLAIADDEFEEEDEEDEEEEDEMEEDEDE